ncbi:MAG: phosphosulfolactate synthase [Anaerolineales bacterium]
MTNTTHNHLDSAADIHLNAWGDLLTDLAPVREHIKPRPHGLTMALDRCQGLTQLADLLTMVGDYLDQVKLSFGTSALLSADFVQRKTEMLRAHQVDAYPGGTLAEIMLAQHVFSEYVQRAKALGFTAIEISDGTLELSPAVRREAIQRTLDAGLKVITEVGKKDVRAEFPIAALCEQLIADLQAGASLVIIEARESGTGVGIYDGTGNIRSERLAALEQQLLGYEKHVMWEAPLPRQQTALITHFGPNVNLGNVRPADVLGLEALRRGLRFDTLRHLAPNLHINGEVSTG